LKVREYTNDGTVPSGLAKLLSSAVTSCGFPPAALVQRTVSPTEIVMLLGVKRLSSTETSWVAAIAARGKITRQKVAREKDCGFNMVISAIKNVYTCLLYEKTSHVN
jgi:hypothetical protein